MSQRLHMIATSVHYSFPVRGEYPAVSLTKIIDKYRSAADAKGYTALGFGGETEQTLLLGCRKCGEPLLRRTNVVVNSKIDCRSCIQKPYDAAGDQFDATVLGKDPNGRHRHDQLVILSCGHKKRLQKSQIQKVARRANAVDCVPCRHARYDTEAKAYGWSFLSMSTDRPSYAFYRHECGVEQEIGIGNMKLGQCSCRQCGDLEKPGQPGIYIFQIDLPNLSVLKFGYSKRHVHRLRRDLRIAKSVPTEILRFLPLPDRPLAISEERKAHRYLRQHHPDWVVPKREFGDAIFVKSEIYRPEALPMMNRLLDEIARKHAAPLS